ncbi:MAG: SufE family protein [Paludibacteraceae bacterium]|jgi:cysteine desulfuration protein SufE|nr:SufE family protein [Paludibacteraceae bacterium]
MTINEIQDTLIEDITLLEDWLDRYTAIIDMADNLPAFPENLKDDEHLIKGCQSQVWIDCQINDEGKVIYTGDSDAIIVKGILSMLVSVLSDHTPEEIAEADLYFIDRIGMNEHLSLTRKNGLYSMLERMKNFAKENL